MFVFEINLKVNSKYLSLLESNIHFFWPLFMLPTLCLTYLISCNFSELLSLEVANNNVQKLVCAFLLQWIGYCKHIADIMVRQVCAWEVVTRNFRNNLENFGFPETLCCSKSLRLVHKSFLLQVYLTAFLFLAKFCVFLLLY